jgi:hypothetical protein
MSDLARAAGLADLPPEKRAEMRAVLAAHAGLFLAAGGTVSIEAWARLDTDERAALAAAGEKLAVDRALLLLQAMRGQTAELSRRVGGEPARVRELLLQEASK